MNTAATPSGTVAQPRHGIRARVVRGLETVPVAPGDSLRPGANTDLAVGVADVALHRVDAEKATSRDLLVGDPPGDEGQDLRLAPGEADGLSGPGQEGFSVAFDHPRLRAVVDGRDRRHELIGARPL